MACFNVKGVWSTWAGNNVRVEERAWIDRKGCSRVPEAVDACWDVKVMRAISKAGPPNDDSAKLKPQSVVRGQDG